MALFKVLLAVQLAFVFFFVSVDSASLLPPKPSPSVLPPKASPVWKRKLVAVQGVVFCRTCRYLLYETLSDAKALPGAIVKLQCNSAKKPTTVTATTDKNGYFYIQVTTDGAHTCRVFLVSSPSSSCKVATDLNGGVKGAKLRLKPKQPAEPSGYTLFTVGPLAFSPDPKTCKKWKNGD